MQILRLNTLGAILEALVIVLQSPLNALQTNVVPFVALSLPAHLRNLRTNFTCRNHLSPDIPLAYDYA
jgi:hypothetical protein